MSESKATGACASVAPVPPATLPLPQPRALTARRHCCPRLLPVLMLLVALVALALGLFACDDSSSDAAARTTNTTAALDITATDSTTWPRVLDLGKAEVVDPDPSTLVESDRHGWAAANNVLVVMEEGQGRAQAEEVAAQIDGTVVGEIEFMDFYQIETSGSSARDLETAIERAGGLPGVKYAVPNGLVVTSATIWGKTCSPLWDPAYDAGDNYVPYQMIGMMEAYAIINASHATLHPVHVGVSDSSVYTGSGQGFAPELHFPDASGAYPESEVRVRGLEARDTIGRPDPDEEGGLTHGTQVTHVISADWGDGVTGVAAGLSEMLTVTCTSPASEFPVEVPEDFRLDDLRGADLDFYATGYYGSSFVELIRQVEAGAEVINLSWCLGGGPNENTVEEMALYEDFFSKMNQAHDDVLFVAAAGNENGGLDGYNYAPGGIAALPNLITVGALDRTGDRADTSDWVTQEQLERWYHADTVMRRIRDGMTFEEYVADALAIGSNYAVGDGEVTISACGTDILVGRDANGNPIVADGTSFAAPQVTAAAAILKSIDPNLTAGEIKEILVLTGDTEVRVSGTTVTVPAEMGGCVLRVDEAVLEVINQMRGPNDQLIHGDLLELMTIELTAEEHEFGYLVKASTPRVESAEGVELIIIVDGEAEIFGEKIHRIYNSLEAASWTVTPGKDPVKVKVYRLDNGACAFLELPGTGGSSTGSTAAGSTTTSEKVEGPRWVRVGEAVVNPERVRLEYHGGGSDLDFFGEPRFQGMFIIYSVSETSFTVKDRWVDHEYESWNVTITCDFDAPEEVLVPGKSYPLTATFSHGGTSKEPQPGEAFVYYSPSGGITSRGDTLEYYPWHENFDGVSSKTWTLTVPEGRAGDTLEVQAGLWNAPPCNVIWTYRLE